MTSLIVLLLIFNFILFQLVPSDVPSRNGANFRNFSPFPRIVSFGCRDAEFDRFDLCCADVPPTDKLHLVNCQLCREFN